MIDNPIFIIGTERSGSNLLRLILNSHSQIAVPHPPHIMRDFSPFLSFYGNLEEQRNFHRLVEDIVRVVNHHFAPWPFKLEFSQVVKKIEVQTLYGIHVALHEVFREFSLKPRWACKSTFMFSHIPEICKTHMNPKFLHLVRDPRDVAASAKNSIFSSYHPINEAKLWLRQQNEIQELREKYLSERSYYHVAYEELVTSPKETISKIMDFLELRFEGRQLNFFETDEALTLSRLSKSWENCGTPVKQDKVGRFRIVLSKREVSQIESIAVKKMNEFGYSIETEATEAMPWPLTLKAYEIFLMLRAESQSLVQDKNAIPRWNKKMMIKKLKTQRMIQSMLRQKVYGME
jgi:hypothetical protein